MSIALEKVKRASERWYLVRLNPARNVTGLLASEGSGIYSLNFPYPISSITRNGSSLTEVSSAPGTNDNWYHNENTGELEIKLAAAPSASNIVIINYYIFMTTSEGEQIYETPTNSASPYRIWNPIISDVTEIRKTIPNAIFGVLTIDDFQITINNPHNDFQQYLTINDSFKDSPALVWLCINSNENIDLVYTGKCQAPSLSNRLVSINVYDSFSKLNQPAYFGDSSNEAFFYKETGSFPDMDAKKHGSLNRLIVGKSSRYRTTPAFPISFFQFKSARLDSENMPEAINTDFEFTDSGTENRTWGLCRLLHDGSGNSAISSTIWGTKSGAVTSGKSTIFAFTTAVWNTMNVEIGDSVKITEAPDVIYGIVVAIDIDTPGTTNVEIYTVTVPTFPNFSTSAVVTSYPCVSLVINQNGVDFLPIYERDYTAVETTTSGGNKYVKIVFINNFESNPLIDPYLTTPSMLSLNPTSDRVFFKIRPNIAQIPMHKHGTYLKKLISSAGIPTNDSTFTDANTDLDVGILTSIPTFQETDYDNYIKYAEDVVSSSLGFIFSNKNGESEYYLLKDPLSTESRNEDYILDNSINLDVNYQDIYTRVISYNINDKSDSEGLSLSVSTAENLASKYLYDINRPRQLVHVLDDVSERIDYHLSIVSNPIYTYEFKTATIDIETEINDDLVINSDFVPSGSVTVKVIGTIRNINETKLIAITFGGN